MKEREREKGIEAKRRKERERKRGDNWTQGGGKNDGRCEISYL